VCDSQTLIANTGEHRNGASDRATDVTLIVGGNSLVSGTLGASGRADLTVRGDSFKGTASVTLSGAQSIKLSGAYVLGGTTFNVAQTIACKQLFSDL
jgi:hypothetical protein